MAETVGLKFTAEGEAEVISALRNMTRLVAGVAREFTGGFARGAAEAAREALTLAGATEKSAAGLDKSTRASAGAGNAAKKAGEGFKAAADNSERYAIAVERAAINVQRIQARITNPPKQGKNQSAEAFALARQQEANQLKSAELALRRAKSAQDSYAKAQDDAARKSAAAAAASAAQAQAQEKSERASRSFTRAIIDAARANLNFSRDSKSAGDAAGNAGREAGNAGSGFHRFGSAAQSAGSIARNALNGISAKAVAVGTVIGNVATAIGRAAINTGRGLISSGFQAVAAEERLNASLTALIAKELRATGAAKDLASAQALAADEAKNVSKFIKKTAIDSPFSKEQIGESLKLAVNYGFVATGADSVADAQKKGIITAQRFTQALVDQAAATGASEQDISRLALAFGQIKAKGKVSAEELNQLREAGFDVNGTLKTLGVTLQEVEKGKVKADAFVNTAIGNIEKDFGGSAVKQGSSIGGLIASLEDLKVEVLTNFFEPVAAAVRPAFASIVEALQTDAIKAKIREFGTAFGQTITKILSGAGKLSSIIKDVMGDISDGLSEGGIAGGVAGGADRILKILGFDDSTARAVGDSVFKSINKITSIVGMVNDVVGDIVDGFNEAGLSGGIAGGVDRVFRLLGFDDVAARAASDRVFSALSGVKSAIVKALSGGLNVKGLLSGALGAGGGIAGGIVGALVGPGVVKAIGAAFAKLGPTLLSSFGGIFQLLNKGFVSFIPKILSTIATVGRGLLALVNPVTLVIGAFALLGAGIATNFGGLGDAVALAFSRITAAIGPVVAELQARLPGAIATASNLWTTVLLPALESVASFIATHVIPTLADIAVFLISNIPTAVNVVSAVWSSVLLPALQTTASFITATVIPALTTIGTWIGTNLPPAIAALSTLWTTTLLPALTNVGTFVTVTLVPALTALALKISSGVQIAVQVLLPIWKSMYDQFVLGASFVTGTLIPAITALGALIQGAFATAINVGISVMKLWEGGFNGIKNAIDIVTGRVSNLISMLANIKIPALLTPGSPTPFENGLRGIASAIDDINRKTVQPRVGAMPSALAERATAAGLRELGGVARTTNNTRQLTTNNNNSRSVVINAPITTTDSADNTARRLGLLTALAGVGT